MGSVSIEQIERSTVANVSIYHISRGSSRLAPATLLNLCISPTFRDCQSRAPLVTQDVETDAAVGVDVGVIDSSREVDLGWLEGVIGGEGDVQEEHTPRVWRVRRSHNRRVPFKQIFLILRWACAAR